MLAQFLNLRLGRRWAWEKGVWREKKNNFAKVIVRIATFEGLQPMVTEASMRETEISQYRLESGRLQYYTGKSQSSSCYTDTLSTNMKYWEICSTTEWMKQNSGWWRLCIWRVEDEPTSWQRPGYDLISETHASNYVARRSLEHLRYARGRHRGHELLLEAAAHGAVPSDGENEREQRQVLRKAKSRDWKDSANYSFIEGNLLRQMQSVLKESRKWPRTRSSWNLKRPRSLEEEKLNRSMMEVEWTMAAEWA